MIFFGTNPHAVLQLPTNQTVTKINVAPSRRKAKVRNSWQRVKTQLRRRLRGVKTSKYITAGHKVLP